MKLRALFVLIALCCACLGQSTESGSSTSSGTSTEGPSTGGGSVCQIIPPVLPNGNVGVAYGPIQFLSAFCAAPETWSISVGTLSGTGLSFSSGGVLGGIPSTAGTISVTITLVDNNGNHPIFPAGINITSSAGGSPTPPDPALLSWNTTVANSPSPNTVVTVGDGTSGICAPSGCSYTSSQIGTALSAVGCGQTLELTNVVYTLPNSTIKLTQHCDNSDWITIERDVTDATFAAEGQRVTPCYAGLPSSALVGHPAYACASPARHMPLLMKGGSSTVIQFGSDTASDSGAAYYRFIGIQWGRPQTYDLDFGMLSLINNVGCTAADTNCMNHQPSHIIFDRNIVQGDAQRQTTRGFDLGGLWGAVIDSYIYDIMLSYGGGGGDAQAFAGGSAKYVTNVGEWKLQNNFASSSTMGCLFCGAFVQPLSPTTNFDGIPHDVWWTQDWFWKSPLWDTQLGQAMQETVPIEGVSYGPQGDQEFIVSPSAVQVTQGNGFDLHNTWFNDSAGGLDRFNDAASAGSVTIDGVNYTTVSSANGIIVKTGSHNVGSSPYQIANAVTWRYSACSGAGVPIASCTAATTPGTHTVTFNRIVSDSRVATLGNNRTLSSTVSITVVASGATAKIAIAPSAPDLQIQPSYPGAGTTDAFGNSRQFCYLFFESPNYTQGALTWSVDSIAGGSSSVGTVQFGITGLVTGEAVYCAGSSTATHTISVTDGTATGSQTIKVSTSSPIWAMDLKAFTSKNGWESKCVSRGLFNLSLVENSWGSNGNGGGQPGNFFLNQPINQANQTLDGNGVTVGYGPEYVSDLLVDHIHGLHGGAGMVLAALSQSLGIHRIKYQHVLMEDLDCDRWGNGFQKCFFAGALQYSGTASTNVLSWTSLTTPLANDINVDHITSVGGTTAFPGTQQWMSQANNNAQFQLGPFSFTNSIILNKGSMTFNNNNGDVNDCNTASGTGTGNTEGKMFQGTGYAPVKPCNATYSIARNALVDNTAAINGINWPTSGTLWQPTDADATLFRNYNNGSGGDYRVPIASQYAAGGARDASDGSDLGADVSGINASDTTVRSGMRFTTLALQTANNTSACSTSSFPSYCTSALPDFQTASANTGAQTVHLSPTGHISQVPIQSYLYPGATTRVIMAYQPWFPGQASCWNLPFAGSSAHPCVGYNENSSSVVAQQHQTMLNEGVTDVSPDWYGNSSGQSFINTTVATQAADLLARCSGVTSASCPMHLMVMVDGGLITSGMSGVSGCPQGAADQTTCITTVLNAAYDYIDATYGRQIYYSTDPVSGQPMTLTFITKGSWSGSNWSTIWTNVKAHMAGYATPYKVIEEYGNFSDTAIDGQYGWPQSEAYSAAAQLCWKGASCSFDYINDLYTKAQANPSKILIGHMFPGFDGSNNNYNNDVTARRCGQTLYDLTQKIWVTGTGFTLYSASNPLNWLLVPTWNDYGEGTNVEDGVDNCYTVSASLTGNVLSWTLNPSDATYASINTIDHFTIWYQDSNSNLHLALDFIPVTTLSENLSTVIPSGTNTIYVEMVGKPLILNRMSGGVSYTH